MHKQWNDLKQKTNYHSCGDHLHYAPSHVSPHLHTSSGTLTPTVDYNDILDMVRKLMICVALAMRLAFVWQQIEMTSWRVLQIMTGKKTNEGRTKWFFSLKLIVIVMRIYILACELSTLGLGGFIVNMGRGGYGDFKGVTYFVHGV